MSHLFQRLFIVAITALILSGCLFEKYLEISDAQFGTFSGNEAKLSNFRATSRISFEVDKTYGWIVRLKTNKRKVTLIEEFSLPVAPASWGPEDPYSKRKISNFGRTATTTKTVYVINGVISHSWKIAPGDPSGEHRMLIKIDDKKPVKFKFVIVDKKIKSKH